MTTNIELHQNTNESIILFQTIQNIITKHTCLPQELDQILKKILKIILM